MNEIKDENQRQRLIFGNWEYDDSPNMMINYQAILDMFTNTLEPIENPEKYMSVDVARHGTDKTVIMVWRGLKVYKIITRSNQNTQVTADLIKAEARKEGIAYSNIVIDEDGIGGGVVDQIGGVVGFIANTRPSDEVDEQTNFQNLKSQCAYKLADMVNTHKIAVETFDERAKEMMIEELGTIRTRNADKDGKLQIETKEDVKAGLGRSPDYSDCMLMRMIFEVRKPIRRVLSQYRPNIRYSRLHDA